MFEGKPPIASGANGSTLAENAGGELSAIDWSELTAKLAAARDLRRELASGNDGKLASFDAHCAQHLASHQGRFPEESGEFNNECGVNPNDLANGKGACANVGLPAENSAPANRGNT